MRPAPIRRRRLVVAALLSLPLAAVAVTGSTVPWTELTEADDLFSLTVRRATFGEWTVYYPAPTLALAEALEKRAAGSDAGAIDARRHLVEARRQLGDLPGAEKALAEWAEARNTPAGWAEAARWAARHRSYPLAFRAAEKALATGSEVPEAERRALATERIAWAEEAGDGPRRLALEASRVQLFPRDPTYLDAYVTRLEEAGKLREAEEAIRTSPAHDDAQRLAALAGLSARHGKPEAALTLLEEHLTRTLRPPAADVARRFAQAADASGRDSLAGWRATLDSRFDPEALVLLWTYFTGKERPDQASDLLVQVERRHAGSGSDVAAGAATAGAAGTLDRPAWLLLSALHEGLDEVAAAFRSRMAAAGASSVPARAASEAERLDDLAALAALALRAGSRPLPWGVYSDEPYRWAARVDVTPGFSTGGLSFLLSGFEREAALAALEERRLPERTFQTARLLVGELERRSPKHPGLPALRVRLMRRHVERGEGSEALALLPEADAGGSAPEAIRAEARRVALLAVRQAKAPIEREQELWRERLALLSPDGSQPEMSSGADAADETMREVPRRAYGPTLREAVSRLSARDKTNRASLTLLLHEMDRLPKAEAVWSFAADRISGWSLTEGVEERYRAALSSFEGAGWWNRLSRWYARHKRQAELAALAEDVVARFRGSEIFARDPRVDVAVPAEGQPNPYVAFGHLLRLKALERFPASPTVVKEAEAALVRRSDWEAFPKARKDKAKTQGVAEDALLASRRAAVLFADAPRRAALLGRAMKDGSLARTLDELRGAQPLTPVAARLLLDGLVRLSRYEEAVVFADRLAEDYPGDAAVAAEALSLHRSLSGLSASHAGKAAALAARAERCLDDPSGLFTELGETWQALDHPAEAAEAWRHITGRSPRDPAAALDEATLFWDYGRPRDGLRVIESARDRLKRPRLHAFEAGVLREEVRDLTGALEEYLAAIRGEIDWNGESEGWSPGEYRAQQRLATLIGRPRVRDLLLQRIQKLRPGQRADEESFATLLTLASLYPEGSDPFDDWMDAAPADTVGSEKRREAREAARPGEREGLAIVVKAFLEKTREMVPKATRTELLQRVRGQIAALTRASAGSGWGAVDVESALLSREAELAVGEEARLAKEMARARYLLSHGRGGEARALASALLPKAEALPDGASRIRALVDWARFEESAETADAAVTAWKRVSAAYPWSLGVLEDHLAFLNRTGRSAEALDLLESSSSTAAAIVRPGGPGDGAAGAAAGHKERLLTRLVEASLAANEVPRARRAAADLLKQPLADERRVSALLLLAKASYRSEAGFDGMALARAEAAKLPPAFAADVYAAVARAAREEGKAGVAVDLFIESLNRRLDTSTLADAARTAARAGRSDALLRFFDAQKRRSPRDVRWAVAVRDVKAFAGDLDGAIAAAREAVDVAPEKKELHEEAVALMSRAGRPAEAAAFLSRWAASRPSDESTADWRAGLYVAAGDLEKAVAVEREAIQAFARDAAGSMPPDQLRNETRERTARAARRFLWKRRAEAAWKLATEPIGPGPAAGAGGSGVARARELPLSAADLTSIALRSGNLVKLLKGVEGDAEFLSEAAGTIRSGARPEQLADLQGWLLSRIFPQAGPPSDEALDRFWSFAQNAGLHRFEEAVARRVLSSRVERPWGVSPPIAFLAGVSPVEQRQDGDVTRYAFSGSDFLAEWARYLDARDRHAELSPLVAARLERIDSAVTGTNPIAAPDDFPAAFGVEALCRLLRSPGHEDDRRRVAGWLRTPASWKRFVEVSGNRWAAKDLLSLVDEETRRAFFRHTSLAGKDGEVVSGVASALAGLVSGRAGAADSPEIVRLRGARTVGQVVEKDPRWLWPELGSSSAPRALWGLTPGEPWFVLEALASYRGRRPEAPWIPLEATNKASATPRVLLAQRLAEGLGADPLALELSERAFGDQPQGDALARRLRLLSRTGAKPRAEELLAHDIRSRQDRLDPDALLGLRALSRELGLTDPLSLLDPKAPVSASLVAALVDWSGPASAASFRAKDPAEARSAISVRLGERLERLSPEETRFWLEEIWRTGGAFPAKAAARLGPAWEKAAPVLANLPVESREPALAALRALPDVGPLRRFAAQVPGDAPEVELLRLFADVAGNADEKAVLSRLSRLLGSGAAFADFHPGGEESHTERHEDGLGPAAFGPVESLDSLDSLDSLAPATRASAAWSVLRASKPELREAARRLLREQAGREIERGPAAVAVWSLALDTGSGKEDLASLLQELERAWARGELPAYDLESLAAKLASVDPGAAARFLPRLPEVVGSVDLERRVRLLAALSRPEEARREIERCRARITGPVRDRSLFTLWRSLPPAPGAVVPSYWSGAAELWGRQPADLEVFAEAFLAHLSKSPYDEAAASILFASLAPAREEVVESGRRAAGATADALWSLRAARLELTRSPRAAQTLLGDAAPRAEDLSVRGFPEEEVNAVLADAARILAASGDRPGLSTVMLQLEERRAPGLAALSAETRKLLARAAPKPETLRVEGGRLRPILPSELTWDLLARVLTTEDVP